MSTTKIIFSLILVISLSSCQPKADANKAQGGVDGSGGNLAKWNYESFKDWVGTEHKYFVRDMFHRLYLIQQNSPEDFRTLATYMNRLLSAPEPEMNTLLDSIQYYVVEGNCPNNQHADKDASVTPDGKVCLSYSAFKYMPLNEFVPQMLLLTLHEISHLKGFNEADAVTLQATVMQTKLRDMTILFYNKNYRDLYEALNRVRMLTALAFYSRYSGDGNEEDSCYAIERAIERRDDFYGPWMFIPSYIRNKIEKEINEPLNLLTCKIQKPKAEREKALAQILNSFVELNTQMANYESPICIDNLCANRKPSPTTLSPEFLLKVWNFDQRKNLPVTDFKPLDPSKISCTLKNAKSEESITLTGSDQAKFGTSIDLQSLDASLSNLSINAKEGREQSGYWAYSINLYHSGNVHLLHSADFFVGFGMIAGHFISRTEQKELQANIEILEEQDSTTGPNEPFSHANNFYMFDPYGLPIHNKPKVLKQFLLTCDLKN